MELVEPNDNNEQRASDFSYIRNAAARCNRTRNVGGRVLAIPDYSTGCALGLRFLRGEVI